MSEAFESMDLGFALFPLGSPPGYDSGSGTFEFDSRGRLAVLIDDYEPHMDDMSQRDFWSKGDLLDVYATVLDVDTGGPYGYIIGVDFAHFDVIILPMPKDDPFWWDTVANGEWRGRIVVVGEWLISETATFPQPIDSWRWINDNVEPITGMSLGVFAIDGGCTSGTGVPRLAERAEAPPFRFTADQEFLQFALTNFVEFTEGTGGVPIYNVQELGGNRRGPNVTEATIGATNWILVADGNTLDRDADCPLMIQRNRHFIEALLTTPIGPETTSAGTAAAPVRDSNEEIRDTRLRLPRQVVEAAGRNQMRRTGLRSKGRLRREV